MVLQLPPVALLVACVALLACRGAEPPTPRTPSSAPARLADELLEEEPRDCPADQLDNHPELKPMRQRVCEVDPDCCNYEGDTCPRWMRHLRLDASTSLVLMECATLGYNNDWAAWIVASDGALKPAPFAPVPADLDLNDSAVRPPEPGARPWLNSAWIKDKVFGATFCQRHICDAGDEVQYRWDGAMFRVARYRLRWDDCCAELMDDVGPWPILWPPPQLCTFRWQRAGDEIELVAVTSTSEIATTIRDIPVVCSVNPDGSLLSCGRDYVSVTSDDADWVVWHQPMNSNDEPERPVVLQRVSRGCKL